MKIIQNKDGSAEMIFEKNEVKAIKKHEKLTMSSEVLRHFGNCLVKIVAEWNQNFNEDVKNLKTDDCK